MNLNISLENSVFKSFKGIYIYTYRELFWLPTPKNAANIYLPEIKAPMLPWIRASKNVFKQKEYKKF